MDMKLSDCIVGQTIRSIMTTDTFAIFFDGMVLTIYNPTEIAYPPNDCGGTALAGSIIKSVDETATEVIITLDCGAKIQVDLRDESFTGPEAMILKIGDKNFIVWR